jgi:hypothetical protein
MYAEDLLGLRFGRLVVIERAGSSAQGQARWMCLCACDTSVIVNAVRLKCGKTQSCGCLRREISMARALVHGEGGLVSRSTEYVAWLSMKARCTNPHNREYAYYGGRGIAVCKRWLRSYKNFLSDMGRRPSRHHSLDRRNNEKGYYPKNCRWATKYEQNRNTRRNRFLTYKGQTKTAIEWSEVLVLPHKLILRRLYYGWSDERTLSTARCIAKVPLSAGS